MGIQLALWSGPRNVSTAMMYSFAQRSDTKVVDEPLFAHFLKSTGVARPSREAALATMSTNAMDILSGLEKTGAKYPVLFVKHIANHIVNLDLQLTKRSCNVILIREPGQVLNSYRKQIEQPTLLDLAYGFQKQLVEYWEAYHIPYLVVDSTDFLQNPEGGLRTICEFANLPFQSNMLSWKPGPRPEDGVWAQYWYHNVHASTGFVPYQKKKMTTVPAELMPIYNECLPYYKFLKKRANSLKP